MNVARILNLVWHACLIVALVMAAMPSAMAQGADSKSSTQHGNHQPLTAESCHEDTNAKLHEQPTEQEGLQTDCDYHCLATGLALLGQPWEPLPIARQGRFGERYIAPMKPYLGVDLRPPIA